MRGFRVWCFVLLVGACGQSPSGTEAGIGGAGTGSAGAGSAGIGSAGIGSAGIGSAGTGGAGVAGASVGDAGESEVGDAGASVGGSTSGGEGGALVTAGSSGSTNGGEGGALLTAGSSGTAGVGGALPSGDCDGAPAASTQSRIRYLLASAGNSADCQPETQYRTCSASVWSAWSGSHGFETCTVNGCPALPESRVRFAAAEANYPAICLSEVQFRACANGVPGAWTGTYTFESCVNLVKACGATPHGGTETRTRYRELHAAYGGSCESEVQTRVCINGELSAWTGSFQHASCDVASPAACDASAHGTLEERTRYAQAVVDQATDCVSEKQTRTCSNGTWSSWSGTPTFTHLTCLVHLDGICLAGSECVEGACNSNHCVCPAHQQYSTCGAAACCKCSNKWSGEDCQTCSGNYDPLKDCAGCKNHWAGNGCARCPAQFSASSGCSACSPGWSGPNCEEQAVCVRFVDAQSKADPQTGYSWAEAYSSLQSALLSVYWATPCQFWVRAGTYSDDIATYTNHAIYGGFAGTEQSLSERDPETNLVVVSGNLGGGATVDGVKFTSRTISTSGGDDDTLRDLILRHVTLSGVQIAAYNVRVLIEDSRIQGGYRTLYMNNGTDLTVRRSRVTGASGGAITVWGGASAVVEDSLILDNTMADGGLFDVEDGKLDLLNTVVAGNQGTMNFSPIFSVKPGVVRITNSTIVDNTTKSGLPVGPVLVIAAASDVQVSNSIIWGNSGQAVTPANAPLVMRSSIVEGGFVGTGNLGAAPTFVGIGADPYRLAPSSKGIDAADGDRAPSRDLTGAARFDAPVANTGSGVPSYADIGAYEWH